jgi:nickel-type superoxide dismutase maturation protease
VQYIPVYTEGVPGLLPLRRFVVRDMSMSPTLRPGDRVVALQWWWRPQVADVVVFREPDAHLTFAVKRIVRIEADGQLSVQGDNLNVSRDSREFGPVPRNLIVGKVMYRYLPAERRGRL